MLSGLLKSWCRWTRASSQQVVGVQGCILEVFKAPHNTWNCTWVDVRNFLDDVPFSGLFLFIQLFLKDKFSLCGLALKLCSFTCSKTGILNMQMFKKQMQFIQQKKLRVTQKQQRKKICHSYLTKNSKFLETALHVRQLIEYKALFSVFSFYRSLYSGDVALFFCYSSLVARALIENPNLIKWSLLSKALAGLFALICGNGYIVGINQIYDIGIDK